MVTLRLRQLVLQPGQRIQLQGIDWAEFEAILDELGDRRSSRIAYCQGVMELRQPSCHEEKLKGLIGDTVKILLEERDIDHEFFGSTTFKRQDQAASVEPDQSFYIENAQRMVGSRAVDLTLDPPPDLAIAVNAGSEVGWLAYQAWGVPELWRIEEGQLRIGLRSGEYQNSQVSDYFPQVDVMESVAQVIARSAITVRSPVLKAFRQQVRSLIAPLSEPWS
jgi:Uma2 family endonuclease